MEPKDWPPSNYSLFFALILLIAAAITLAMSDEILAKNLAIYAYYLLVIGVTIRFFELSLSNETKTNLRGIAFSFLKRIGDFFLRMYRSNIIPSNFILKIRLSNKEAPKTISTLKDITKKSLFSMMIISKEVSVYLSVLFALLFIYGSAFGWWIVWGYLKSLVLIIISFLTLHIILCIFVKQLTKD